MIDLDATVLAAAQDAFAEWATWTPQPANGAANGAAQRVPIIFFDNSREQKFQDDEQVEQIVPVASVRLSQFAGSPEEGDTLLIRGVLYAIRSAHADGEGAAKLVLRFANDAQDAVTPAAPDPVTP